jgi:hypothetical protein
METPANADTQLIAALRGSADALPEEATETAGMLRRYALEIENHSTREAAVARFDEFAAHYKGLRDLIVPGIPQDVWDQQVNALRSLARSAMKLRRTSWWRRLVG